MVAKRTFLGLWIVILLLICPRAVAQDDDAAFRAQVSEIFAEITEAINSGDLDRWLALWAEDGIQMPPGESVIVGKSQIRKRLEPQFDQFDWNLSMILDEVRQEGDLGYARGTYKVTLSPKAGGNPIPVDGKYLIVLTRGADGSWRIYRDIFNSNVPVGDGA